MHEETRYFSREKKTERMNQRLKLKKNIVREVMYDVDGPIIRHTTDKKITNETVNRSTIITPIKTERRKTTEHI